MLSLPALFKVGLVLHPAMGPCVESPCPRSAMHRVFLSLSFLIAVLLVSGCQLTRPGAEAGLAAVPSALGQPITTTTLAPPSAAPAGGVSAASDRPAAAARSGPMTGPAPRPRPSTDPASVQTGPPPDGPSEPDVTATAKPKSAAQVACEVDRGLWSRTGSGEIFACVQRTRDGGKRCDSKSDCDGECLARSRSCSPLKPLFGCNEVLMDNGAAVTLCLE